MEGGDAAFASSAAAAATPSSPAPHAQPTTANLPRPGSGQGQPRTAAPLQSSLPREVKEPKKPQMSEVSEVPEVSEEKSEPFYKFEGASTPMQTNKEPAGARTSDGSAAEEAPSSSFNAPPGEHSPIEVGGVMAVPRISTETDAEEGEDLPAMSDRQTTGTAPRGAEPLEGIARHVRFNESPQVFTLQQQLTPEASPTPSDSGVNWPEDGTGDAEEPGFLVKPLNLANDGRPRSRAEKGHATAPNRLIQPEFKQEYDSFSPETTSSTDTPSRSNDRPSTAPAATALSWSMQDAFDVSTTEASGGFSVSNQRPMKPRKLSRTPGDTRRGRRKGPAWPLIQASSDDSDATPKARRLSHSKTTVVAGWAAGVGDLPTPTKPMDSETPMFPPTATADQAGAAAPVEGGQLQQSSRLAWLSSGEQPEGGQAALYEGQQEEAHAPMASMPFQVSSEDAGGEDAHQHYKREESSQWYSEASQEPPAYSIASSGMRYGDWEVCYTLDDMGLYVYYYYNVRTGESSWTPPWEQSDAQEAASAGSAAMADDSGSNGYPEATQGAEHNGYGYQPTMDGNGWGPTEDMHGSEETKDVGYGPMRHSSKAPSSAAEEEEATAAAADKEPSQGASPETPALTHRHLEVWAAFFENALKRKKQQAAQAIGTADPRILHEQFMDAVRTGNASQVASHLALGVSVFHVDDNGFAPLHLAAATGNAKVMALLCSAAVEESDRVDAIDVRDSYGNTPLHVILGMASSAAAKADAKQRKAGKSRKSGRRGRVEVKVDGESKHSNAAQCVRILLQSFANSNVKNRAGDTPLHLAASAALTACIKELLEYDADACVASKDGTTPLDRVEAVALTDPSAPSRYETCRQILDTAWRKQKKEKSKATQQEHRKEGQDGLLWSVMSRVGGMLKGDQDEHSDGSDTLTSGSWSSDEVESDNEPPMARPRTNKQKMEGVKSPTPRAKHRREKKALAGYQPRMSPLHVEGRRGSSSRRHSRKYEEERSTAGPEVSTLGESSSESSGTGRHPAKDILADALGQQPDAVEPRRASTKAAGQQAAPTAQKHSGNGSQGDSAQPKGSSLMGWLSRRILGGGGKKKGPKIADMGDEGGFYYDETLNRWVVEVGCPQLLFGSSTVYLRILAAAG